jgi:hypothetical protein
MKRVLQILFWLLVFATVVKFLWTWAKSLAG